MPFEAFEGNWAAPENSGMNVGKEIEQKVQNGLRGPDGLSALVTR